jgi:murein DD-endopeptidase MepM/ murein hydrolase activator NlpD
VRSRAWKPPTGTGRLLAATSFATLALGAGLAQAQTSETTTEEPTATSEPAPDEPTTAGESAGAAAVSGGLPSGGVNTGDGSGGSGDGSAGDDPSSGEESGGDQSASSGGGKVELLLANAKPRKAFVAGSPAVFHYEISNSSASDLEIQFVSRKTGEVARTVKETGIPAQEEQSVKWKGESDDGKLAKTGEYKIRVTSTDGEKADVSRAKGKRKAGLYLHKFPVRGKHDYWDGIGAGRGHQGQDVGADCGTKLVAAHAGRVQTKAYHGAAGYYVVIDGKKTSFDYVYMHLKDKADVSEGEKVKTGEKIGRVGETGNASGCHLHFELWSKPGWYEGGHFMGSVTKKLKKWDRYS